MTRTVRAAVMAVCLAMTAPAVAQSPSSGGEGGTRPLRVLLTYGGHGFEQQAYFKMLDELPNVTWKKILLPGEAGMLKPGLEQEFDVILMYDMIRAIAPEHQAAFGALIKSGTIGLVSMHHNIGAHRDWEEWPKIVGGRWMHEKSKVMDGKTYLQTHAVGLNEPVTLPVKVNQSNPVGKGVGDFTVQDEFYVGLYIRPDVTPLLTSDHPEARQDRGLLGWTNVYHGTRVFYMRLGHFSSAYNNPNWRKVFVNGLRWTACAQHKEFCS